MKQMDESVAEQRVLQNFAKLHPLLMKLVDSLQDLEPLGTFVDEAEFSKGDSGNVQVKYKARPMQLAIVNDKKRFILRIEDV